MTLKLYDMIRREQKRRNDPPPEDDGSDYVPPPPVRRTSWRFLVALALSLAFLGALYLLGVRFVHATVVINERRIPFSLDRAELEMTHATGASPDRLSFQTMIVTTTVTRQIYGSNLADATAHSRGSVVIINTASKASKTLRKGAVLVAKNGLRYSLVATVKVPGYTVSGGKIVPGTSGNADIIASGTGPSYNQSGTTFTIHGHSPKTFYAQSSSDIVGGDTGLKHSLTESERQQAIADLQTQLGERLRRETRAQIPADFITFPYLQFVSIDLSSLTLSGSGVRFPATMKGTMVSYLVPRDLFASALAAKAVRDVTYPSVDIPELGSLVVEPTTAIPTDPSAAPDAITVAVSGQGTIITRAPVQRIKDALVGARTSSFDAALSDISEIDTARYSLLPFWSPFFPRDERAIAVETR